MNRTNTADNKIMHCVKKFNIGHYSCLYDHKAPLNLLNAISIC